MTGRVFVALLGLAGGCRSGPDGRLLYALTDEGTGVSSVHWRDLRSGAVGDVASPCGGSSYPEAADPLGHAALVVCTSGGEDDHLESLWLVPWDGTAPVALGQPARMVRNPVFEADGLHVWFESSAVGFRDLYRVARDGSALTLRVSHPAGNYEPDPHPTSGEVVFVSSRDGQAELYLAGPEGAAPVRWTDAVGDDMAPRWVPHLDRVAFLTDREGRKRLWTRAPSGRVQPLLPTGTGEHASFVLSPTGDAVAITTLPEPGKVQVDVVGMDGDLGWSWVDKDRVAYPAWSPDGRWLVASVGQDVAAALVVRDASGGRSQVVPTPAGAWLARWGRAP
ncbi:MAG: hypothetical protein RLZZ383_408 [Pseudomonadota bacterium]